LPVPFAPGEVNAYLLHGDDQWALVDCGLGTRESDAALATALQSLGIGYADLSALVLTHAHSDHIAPAGDIATQMPPAARVIALDHDVERLLTPWQSAQSSGMTQLTTIQMLGGLSHDEAELGLQGFRMLTRLIRPPAPERVRAVAHGDVLPLAGRAWQVFWTPGHAPGHLCLVSGNIIITGDHILPQISPNVSFSSPAWPDPIQDHLDSLARIAALDLIDPIALPGHGQAFTRLAERIEELRDGHERRSALALATLRAQDAPTTAITIAEAIFRGRLRTPGDRWMALGETLAHLEHLRVQGHIMREDRASVAYYRADAAKSGEFADFAP
jgi:glyoxylase-like metal-dependent hydrolase (beta-lactamase superfamily II)